MRFDESLRQCRRMVWGATDGTSIGGVIFFHFRGHTLSIQGEFSFYINHILIFESVNPNPD
jgi:hypothetical protein